MSLDSIDKRRSVCEVPGLMTTPTVDGTISVQDRRHLSDLYAFTPTIEDPFFFWRKQNANSQSWAKETPPTTTWVQESMESTDWVNVKEYPDG